MEHWSNEEWGCHMPNTGGELVQECAAIAQLDDHINSSNGATYASALDAGENPAFVSGGPLEESDANWGTAWVNETGQGGTYWPYVTDIDLTSLIKGALTQSVQAATTSGKIHNTVWINHGEPPEEYRRGEAVPREVQEQLFKTAVYETDRVVTLVILTPQPV